MTKNVDPQIEQLKSGITTFIFSWLMELTKRGNNPLAATDEVVGWVRSFCDSLEEEQKLAANQNKDNNIDD